MIFINLFILLVILVFLTVLSLYITNWDLFSPITLSVGSFALVVSIAFFYNFLGNYDISFITIITICFALTIFIIGFFIGKQLLKDKMDEFILHNNKQNCMLRKKIFYKKKLSIIILLVVFIGTILNIRQTLLLAKSVNANANILNMLEYARNAELFLEIDRNYFLVFLVYFISAAGYVYTYILINNYLLSSNKIKDINFNYLLIVTLSLICQMMGTGRTFLIKYITFCLIVYYYLNLSKINKRHFSFSQMLKTLRKSFLMLIIFFLLFQLFGLTTNKTQKRSAIDMLYIYSGSSIVALDQSIKMYEKDDRFFGEESFYGLYGTLNKFGFHIPNEILHLENVEVGENLETNIYTSLRTYIYDFGFVGMYIVQFILGVVLGVFNSLIQKYKSNPIFLLVYSFLMYGVVMQGIGEIQLRNFMSITNICIFIFYVFLYFLLFKKIRIKLS